MQSPFFVDDLVQSPFVVGELRAVQRAGPGGVRLVPRALPREGVQGRNTSRAQSWYR